MFAYRHFFALSTSSFVFFGSVGSAIAQETSIPHLPSAESLQPSAPKATPTLADAGTTPTTLVSLKLEQTAPITDHLLAQQGVLTAATTTPKSATFTPLARQGSLSPARLTAKTPVPMALSSQEGLVQESVVFEATPAIAQTDDSTTPQAAPGQTVESPVPSGTPASTTPRVNSIPPELQTNPELNELLTPIVAGNEALRLPTTGESITADEPLDLSLEEAVAIALTQNPELQEAKLAYDRAEYQRQEAIAAEHPTLTNQTELIHTDSTSSELQAEAFGRDTEDNSNTSLSNRLEVSYDIYTGGSRSGQISTAEAQLSIAELEIARITKEIRLKTEVAYYDLQNADYQTAIESSAVQNAEKSLDDADKLEKAGLGTKFDVLRAQVDLANAEQRRIRAEANQNIARRKLAQLLNLDPKADPQATDEPGIAGVWELSLEDSILLALQQREELRQQLLEWEISGYQAEIALANLRPQLSVFANYDLLDVFDDELDVADGISIGGRIFWNLFDGGAASARSKQSRVNQQISETRFINQSDQIRLAVENAYYDLNASDRNIQTASIAVDLAQQSLDLARARFRAGVGTQTDVISASTELNTARNNLLQAITDYNRAYAQLKREVSVGEELEMSPSQ